MSPNRRWMTWGSIRKALLFLAALGLLPFLLPLTLSAQVACPIPASASPFGSGREELGLFSDHAAPAPVQVDEIIKSLLFDRRLLERMGRDTTEMLVAVAYIPDDSASSAEMEEIVEAFRGAHNPFGWIPIRGEAFPFRDPPSFQAQLHREGAAFVWVVSAGGRLESLLESVADQDIPTLTGVPGYVAQGVGIGMVERRWREGKDQPERMRHRIQVNLPVLFASGVDLNSGLLKLVDLCGGTAP